MLTRIDLDADVMIVVSDVGEHHSYVDVYKIVGFNHGEPEFGRDGDINNGIVAVIGESKPYFSVFVKRDGCCDFTFNDSPYHFCDKEMIYQFGKVLEACYDLANQAMNNVD